MDTDLNRELDALRAEAPNPDSMTRLVMTLQRTRRSNNYMKIVKLSLATCLTVALIGTAVMTSTKATAAVNLRAVVKKLRQVSNYHLRSYHVTGNNRVLASETWVLGSESRTVDYLGEPTGPKEVYVNGQKVAEGDVKVEYDVEAGFGFDAGGTPVKALLKMLQKPEEWKITTGVAKNGRNMTQYDWDVKALAEMGGGVTLYVDSASGLPAYLQLKLRDLGFDYVEDVYEYDTVKPADVHRKKK